MAHWVRVRRRVASVVVVLAALLGTAAVPAPVAAHPLGNFTINHYVGLRVAPDAIRLDVVLDRAEIATFEERSRLDRDDDGTLSEAEIETARSPACRTLAGDLVLTVDGAAVPLELVATGLSFPRGAAGLPTMRLVCGFVAPFPGSAAGERRVSFANDAFLRQQGWSEIVVEGDGTTVEGDGLRAETISERLTAYPPDMLQTPLDTRAVEFTVRSGGPTLPPWSQPDADPLPGAPEPPGAAASATPAPAAVPPGSGSLPDVFGATTLTPPVLSLALATAFGLGAAHALTPGHGKTIAAAWLVGTRGTARQAIALALAVTVAHTLGILVLAFLIAVAQTALPADLVARRLPLVAALAILAVGAWMLVGELRRRTRTIGAVGHEDHHHVGDGHRFGWRSLFAVGLGGGIVPSTSALLILLAAIATGRPLFGVVLVLAFGLGMALVLGGLGVVVVHAHGWLERRAPASARAAATWLPLVAAALVLAIGLWLTGQAVATA